MTKVLAVAGVKNSGKTTLMERLTAGLTGRGLQVAVIKHDGHAFAPDRPGTDTARALEAGAYGCAVFDGGKYQLVKRVPVSERELMGHFPEADLILLEGFKASAWPKLEVVRAGNSSVPVCDPATLVALVTDVPGLELPGVPRVELADWAALTELIWRWMGGDGTL